MSLAQRRSLVDPAACSSVRQQCQWLGLARSSYYYQPVPAPSQDLLLMRLLDEQYLETPQYGYKKMGLVLAQAGYVVNRKRVRRLMQTMGSEAIYPTDKPVKTSRWPQYLPVFIAGIDCYTGSSGLGY